MVLLMFYRWKTLRQWISKSWRVLSECSVNVMARTRDGQEEFANPQPSSSQCILPLFPRPSWRQSVDFCGAKTASGRSVSDVTPADTHAVSLFARGSENRPEIVGRKSAAQSSKWESVTVVANHFLGQECCCFLSATTLDCDLSTFQVLRPSV